MTFAWNYDTPWELKPGQFVDLIKEGSFSKD